MSISSNSYILIPLTLGICLFGLIMIGNASAVTAFRDFGDRWHYFKLQTTWAVIGMVGFLFASKFPLNKLEKIASPFFGLTLLLLVLVLFPGIGNSVLGARRWISIGPLPFQPAELAKISTSIYIAKLFKTGPRFAHLCVVSAILTLLIMLEPDMGTTVVILGSCLLTYLGSGGQLKYLSLVTPIVGLLIVGLIIISPYRLARVKTFINPSHDPLGASYQIRQALIGLGSGGIFGVGIGQSRQKYDFLPEVTTDSIFAVVGEEMGLVGTSLLALAFLGLTLTALNISRHAPIRFQSILSMAIASWLGLQAFINMSANVALLPFTGIPLPFVSYGGTALLVNLTAAGLLLNISKK